MIVVVGVPGWDGSGDGRPAGRACEIALAAAAAGSRVELVGRTGDDPAGDALVLALAAGGVGHVALLRDPARPTRRTTGTPPKSVTERADAALPADDADLPADGAVSSVMEPAVLEPADVSLGLRYLTSYAVLVVTDDAPADVLPVCVESASFVGASLVVALRPGSKLPPGTPAEATVLVAPVDDEGAFARLLGTYAAALDRGEDPGTAFAAATSDGWERRDR